MCAILFISSSDLCLHILGSKAESDWNFVTVDCVFHTRLTSVWAVVSFTQSQMIVQLHRISEIHVLSMSFYNYMCMTGRHRKGQTRYLGSLYITGEGTDLMQDVWQKVWGDSLCLCLFSGQAVLKIDLCFGEFTLTDFSLGMASSKARLIPFNYVHVWLVNLP